MKKVIFSILVGVLMCILAGCGTTTIDLNKYVTIEADGYDNAGTAKYEVAWDEFAEDYYKKISLKKKNQEIEFLLTYGAEPIEIFRDMCIDYQLENDKDLSNGDIVTFIWDCDEEAAEEYFGCKIKCSDIEYEVEGLEEIPTFDPFEYISINFTGVSPYAFAEYKLDYTKPEMQYIDVNLSDTGNLEIGEEITVTVNVSKNIGVEGFVEKYGVIPGSTEKIYKVEGIPAYITDIADLSEEELKPLTAVDEELRGRITTLWEDPTSLQNVEYVGYYFLKPKPGMGFIFTYSQLYVVYKATAVNPNVSEPFEYYVYDMYENLGTIDGKLQYGDPAYPVLQSGWIVSTKETFLKGDYRYAGFETLDALYQDKIVNQLATQEFTTNIKQ